jgi:steroid delta-isomerase
MDFDSPHVRWSPAFRAALLSCALLATAAVHADVAADQTAITQRLQRWALAFNARDAAGTCDLFAPELISTVPEVADAGRDVVCARLATLLARRDATFHYGVDIHEIIVTGDIAIVRLTWTLAVTRGAVRSVSLESGMDVFRRDAQGTWSIIRFIAFSADAPAR